MQISAATYLSIHCLGIVCHELAEGQFFSENLVCNFILFLLLLNK